MSVGLDEALGELVPPVGVREGELLMVIAPVHDTVLDAVRPSVAVSLWLPEESAVAVGVALPVFDAVTAEVTVAVLEALRVSDPS